MEELQAALLKTMEMDVNVVAKEKTQLLSQLNAYETEKERDALKAYGITLAPDHYEGYQYKPSRFEDDDTKSVKKPWEQGILEQFGPSKAVKCETIDGWNNEDFLFEVREGIAYCTLNRPAANNAMNETISAGMHDSGRILRSRPDIRIAVLTGAGRFFCAGGDPKSFQAAQGVPQEGEEDATGPPSGASISAAAGYLASNKQGTDAFARDCYEWASLPQFTICCLNGSAMGGGVGLMCCTDMVVAVRTAHATLSEVRLGVIPAVISPHVIRTIGTANAKRLFCTAENTNMTTAMEMGLVQRVVNDVAEFPAVIKEIAQKIQSCAPGALAIAKQTVLNALYQPASESLIEYTAREYARIRKTKECEEGMAALGNKKKPTWVGSAISVKDA
jgi:enoyl-CoA hydratase/carnithine racemase